MPSPFPGMDPYLENKGFWPDVHFALIAAMRDEINARLPSGYVARSDRHIWLYEQDGRKAKLRKPDVYVTSRGNHSIGVETVARTPAPKTVVLSTMKRAGNRFVKILELPSRRVVTIIELLSYTNKIRDRDAYLAKRMKYLASNINLVEIDLLRKGERLPLGGRVPKGMDYYVLVCRTPELPRAGLWPFSVRDTLPEFPIPLDPGKSDIALPLRECLDVVYDRGHYDEEIDYSHSPVPPLANADMNWARKLIARRAS